MNLPNTHYLSEQFLGNQEMVQAVLRAMGEEFPTELENYHSFMKNGELKQASHTVHKIRHKISLLGMGEDYMAIAADYEAQLLDGNVELEGWFSDLIDVIKEFLERMA